MEREFEIDFPNILVTPPDLFGRALRETRLNWRPLLALFWVPCLINNLSGEVMYWFHEYAKTGISTTLLAIITVIAIVANVWSRVQIEARTVELLSLLRRRTDAQSAKSTVARQYGAVVLLSLPILVADLLLFASIMGMTTSFGALAPSGMAGAPRAVIVLLTIGLFALLCVPYTMLCVLNAFFANLVVQEGFSISKGIRRFFYLVTQSPLYIIGFAILATACYYFFACIYAWMSTVVSPYQFFTGTTKEVVKIIWQFTRSLLLCPLPAWWFASLAICGAFLYDQLRMKLEAPDLSGKIDELRRHAS